MNETQINAMNKMAKIMIVKKFPNYFRDIIFEPVNVEYPEVGNVYVTFVITEEFLDIIYEFSSELDERASKETKEEFYQNQYNFTSQAMDYLKDYENFRLSKSLMNILEYVNLKDRILWVKEIIVDYGSEGSISKTN